MVSWPNSCCCVYVFFVMCVCDVCTLGKQCHTNLFEEKFCGLVEDMLKMLKVIFPIWKTHFCGAAPLATTDNHFFGTFGWGLRNGGRQKCVIGVAKKIYYWNLSCLCSLDWVCYVWQRVWVNYKKMSGLKWVRYPWGLRGPQKWVKTGALVRASKHH